MKSLRALLAAAAIVGVAGCSFENGNEREADRLTRAVVNNDLRPVQNDLGPGINVTRVKVAEWSDELNEQGKLISVKETKTDCDPGWHCFDARFEKQVYHELLRFDENHKVVDWQFHMAQQ